MPALVAATTQQREDNIIADLHQLESGGSQAKPGNIRICPVQITLYTGDGKSVRHDSGIIFGFSMELRTVPAPKFGGILFF